MGRLAMTKPPEIIETARLILRPPLIEDAEAIFMKYAQDSEVTKYLIWRPHKVVEETKAFIERCIQGRKNASNFAWVVIQKEEHTLFGMIELRITGDQADFGYVLARDAWGQGYASEMVKAVVSWTLVQPEIQRVWATCDCENPASARVLEKAGLKFVKVLKRYIVHPNISEDPQDSLLYSLSN
jgi:[ribosomal protein S5]-alanine N-acetyltransferase